MEKRLKPATLCVRAGYQPKNGEPVEPPIVQSTTFKYDDSEEMGMLFDLKKEGYFYTRLQNPTNDAVANKIAALEGGVAAVLTSSGQAANFYAVFNICEAGDHIVASNEIYGGTFNLFGVTLKKLGIDCTFVNPESTEAEIEAAFRPNTKALFGETISNPGCKVLDIEKFAAIAHRHGVPLIVDNTFATPINCRPFEWGADIVTHSTTKYMDGFATQVGGCVVDSGNFDWSAHAEKFPGLCQPDDSYHGLTYTQAFGKMAYITKIVSQLMRDLGSVPAPMNSFLLNVGLQTLHLRMQRHCENAQRIAEFLRDDSRVAWIDYPGLPGDKCHELAKKYLPNGSCGVIAFGLKGDRATAIRFMDALKLAHIATHVADARTCVLHPASHTHRQLSDEQLREAGIAPDFIRLSVGIEDCEDILDDIKQALDQI
ncbi:MAG TPA: O-acetylhomoserine aminocarboxypropyltransferase/cysteine synthase [Candidatus Prevotella avicola]|uniref:O-acetylhomoserine aminocarboxypropyltransferase/cysteine synthase n=1 Tax=Candidatus Prevotella avicola TaxID=2838738 RepID=A0A9D2JVX2_9BACT|nr:O-acetylhomoserine aminocarboxypropyltransferase/cysteine synthase [Candidatus Prevotella avicola]